ncbi:hypothetical protein GSY69_10645 [Brevibacterium sp. 5221]|uniref:Lipoprotein n=1 Tax=Brevibacterium rongguiense TaxID=2695267 RepID=A0A6N9H9I8_9MICO|nr:hypothetical protein [Brevibacterium rongguiense]MYM20406.1 hypothetical protein [Brevibacterium rongguiense]
MSALSSTRRFPALRLAAASTMLVALLAAGCGGPEQTAGLATPPASGESSATPSPTLPPYTTTLTLTEEQKTAADAAASSFNSFVNAANDAYKAKDINKSGIANWASGPALEGVREGVESLQKENLRLDDDFTVQQIKLIRISKTRMITDAEFRGCVPYSKIRIVHSDGTTPSERNSTDSEFRFIVQNERDGWRVNKQELVHKQCGQ